MLLVLPRFRPFALSLFRDSPDNSANVSKPFLMASIQIQYFQVWQIAMKNCYR